MNDRELDVEVARTVFGCEPKKAGWPDWYCGCGIPKQAACVASTIDLEIRNFSTDPAEMMRLIEKMKEKGMVAMYWLGGEAKLWQVYYVDRVPLDPVESDSLPRAVALAAIKNA